MEANLPLLPHTSCPVSQLPKAVTACGAWHQVSSVRYRRMQVPKEISALQLQRGTSGWPCEAQLAEDTEAQVFTLGSAAAFWQQRTKAQPHSRACGGHVSVLRPFCPVLSFFLEQVSLPSVSHLPTPCLSWLFLQSQFYPNTLGFLPRPFISPKLTIPVPLSSFPYCIPVSVPSPPGPCPRLPPPVCTEEAFALPWIYTQPIALAYKNRNQKVFWDALLWEPFLG